MGKHLAVNCLDRHETALSKKILELVSPAALGHRRDQPLAKPTYRVLMAMEEFPIKQSTASMGLPCRQDGWTVPFSDFNLLMKHYLVVTNATDDDVTYSISKSGRAVVSDVKELLGVERPPPPKPRVTKRVPKFVVQPTPQSTGHRLPSGVATTVKPAGTGS
jgi:hypothetical protein